MKIIGVIPARWASTRFPGKILAKIAGKPMIEHVWLRAKKAKLLNDVIVACDEEFVREVVVGFKAKAVMTNKDHPSGSDRIAEAVKKIKCDVVINIQGDEPLIDPKIIDDLAKVFLNKKNKNIMMATVIKEIKNEEDIDNPNVVKVVIDQNKDALYFSRSRIPYNRSDIQAGYFKHLGIYAYRKDFLLKFTKMPKSRLEEIESLEQLRVLEAGYKIKTIVTDFEAIGVDTQEDLINVEKRIKHG